MCTLESRKQAFLERTGVNNTEGALVETWQATVKRNPTYMEGTRSLDKLRLGDAVKEKLKGMENAYRSQVSAEHHLANIVDLAATVSREFGPILKDGRFRIGGAQKAVNLFAKYLWCLGLAWEPPHCPLDNRILRKAGIIEAWTRLDCSIEYVDWIDRLASFTSPRSLSDWELDIW